MSLGGHRKEDQFWVQTMTALATYLGALPTTVHTRTVCIDPQTAVGQRRLRVAQLHGAQHAAFRRPQRSPSAARAGNRLTMTTAITGRRPSAAALAGGAMLLLAAALVALSFLARQPGYPLQPIMIAIPTAAVGVLVARHQPRNPNGWLLLGIAAAMLLSTARRSLLAARLPPRAGSPPWPGRTRAVSAVVTGSRVVLAGDLALPRRPPALAAVAMGGVGLRPALRWLSRPADRRGGRRHQRAPNPHRRLRRFDGCRLPCGPARGGPEHHPRSDRGARGRFRRPPAAQLAAVIRPSAPAAEVADVRSRYLCHLRWPECPGLQRVRPGSGRG